MLMLTVDNSFDGNLLKNGEKILSRKRENEERNRYPLHETDL